MRNEKVIEYTKRIDDLSRAQVVQGMAVRELSDLELVIISGRNRCTFDIADSITSPPPFS